MYVIMYNNYGFIRITIINPENLKRITFNKQSEHIQIIKFKSLTDILQVVISKYVFGTFCLLPHLQ